MRYIYSILIPLLITSCNTNKNIKISHPLVMIKGDTSVYKKLQNRWYYRNYSMDSMCGISLKKAYDEIIKGKPGKEIIVALIDQDINTEHEDLKDFIWINNEEIIGNGIDDDKNGYIDDINGWNFLRQNSGERIIYSNYSSVNYVRKYEKKYGLDSTKNKDAYEIYKSAKKDIIENEKNYEIYLKQSTDYQTSYEESKKQIDSLFKDKKPSLDELDSVYYEYETSNSKLSESAGFIYDHIAFDYKDFANLRKEDALAVNEISNNLDFDFLKNIEDKNLKLGSPKVNGDLNRLTHGTRVAGVIVANMSNDLGTEGVTNNVKLMVLSAIARQGVEEDEILAEAIRYAVNNGASVINFSSSKSFSFDYKKVEEALKYAEDNNVLFVTSSGNGGRDVDTNIIYPNSNYNNRRLSNVLTVGGSYAYVGEELKISWSNYGKENVDLFAPGVQIKTTTSKGNYKLDSGSSLATALVTGVVAMIYSYNPDLTVKEIKNSIVSSVDTYDADVAVNDSTKVKFKELSRSGGILNAFGALKKAEEFSSLKLDEK